jgi:chromosome segregation protein
MYLSKLELHGFKSFAQRTVVHFSPGITVVVGPNGCGKSNIVDAVRWVIGEQRARILRSEKMENVIFNGTLTRRALGMSEVLLTVENTRGILPTEYTEVTIGRRLYRSGESEYLLNGVQCRLKDITDLFMDTGMGAGAYSVIELKMIEDLLSENAQDRRHLFEEAAGITRYKVRRAQTLRKLDGTQADLVRVRDLTEELDRQVRSLERQARKAGRFRALQEELRTLETALAQSEYDRLRDQAEGARRERRLLADRLEAEGARLAEAEARHEAHRTEHIDREQRVTAEQGRQAAQVDALRKLESDERITRERLAVAVRDLERLAGEAQAALEHRSALEARLDTLARGVGDAVPALEAADAALEAARTGRDAASARTLAHRQRLDALLRTERAAADARADAQRALDRVTSRLEMLRDELRGIDERLDPARDAVSEALRAADAARDTLETAANARSEARAAFDGLVQERTALEGRLERALETLRDAQRRQDAVGAEVALLESLLSSYDDFAESVQHLATERDWTTGELRTVADLLSCDEAHRPALEAAIGAFADCVVVATEDEARRAIGRLRTDDKGRATFLVLERLPAPGPEPDTALRPLASVVRVADPAAAPLVPVLLRGAYLVDHLDDALAAARRAGSGRFFAPSGEWVDHDGMVQGGGDRAGRSPASGRIGRREQLADLVERLSEAEAAVSAAQADADAARASLEALPIGPAEQAERLAEQQVSSAERELARLAAEHAAAVRRAADIEQRRGQITAAAGGGEEEIAALSAALDEAERLLTEARRNREQVEEKSAATEEDLRSAETGFNDARVASVEARNRHDNLKRELDRAREDLARLEREQVDREERIAALGAAKDESEARITTLTDDIRAARSALGEINQVVDAARDVLSETRVAISAIESELREFRRSREATLREENQLAIRETELTTRTEDLVAGIREDFEVDLTATRFEIPDGFVEATARTEASELRSKIRGLGPVNALALDSFEEERERLEFMRTQLRDLESAEATLLETITEINTTASERFRTTFEQIRTNFTGLFSRLFGEETTADIVLENPDDLLESAIEIMAKPRGKKPSVLAQLSGGEKTLTAIALLFAIYLVKPSPFCILDEVDAPLDDANVDRFMTLIRSFADTTQFILVTHNKRTMEAADRMYGITMQEQGVSRLVGVKFDEVLEAVA